MEPKLIGGRPPPLTGPPLGIVPLAPLALMTTDVLRPWLPLLGVPFGTVFPACGPPCAMPLAPFTEESLTGFAFCAGAEAPAGVEVGGVAVLKADA